MRYQDYYVLLETTERLLGSSPADSELYRQFIANKPGAPGVGAGSPEREEEELASLPVIDEPEKGLTVFPRDPEGRLHAWDYQVKGFLKEAGNLLKDQLGIKALRDKLDNYVYVAPRRILFCRDGQALTQPDGIFTRPLRAMTMRGPRVTLSASEYVDPPIRLAVTLRLLYHKEVTEEVLRKVLAVGELRGLGQWRNGGFGRMVLVEFGCR